MIVAPGGTGSLTTTQLRSAVASTVIVTLITSPRVSQPLFFCETMLTDFSILYPANKAWVSGTAADIDTAAHGPAPPDCAKVNGACTSGNRNGPAPLAIGQPCVRLTAPSVAVVTPCTAFAG